MSNLRTSMPLTDDPLLGPSAVAAFGRLLLATIFLLSGLEKITAVGGTIAYIGNSGLPAPELAYGAAVVVEIFGGLALLLGYKTRIVAAALAVFTIAAALAFHADLGDQNQFIHFMKNIAMAGGLLQVLAFGPGSFSLDKNTFSV
jgi:putative oxidoreductase